MDFGRRTSRLLAAAVFALPLAFASSATAADFQFLHSWGETKQSPGIFSTADGVAVGASGDVYTVDNGEANDRVQKFTPAGHLIKTWGGHGSGDGQLSNAIFVAVDGAENVYVTDYDNNRVVKYDSDGNFLLTWGWGVQDGSAAAQVCTSGCQAGIGGSGAGQLQDPTGIAVGSNGDVYLSSSNRVMRFTSGGAYVADIAGAGNGSGQVEAPFGIAADSSGSIYVAEQGNNRVSKFSNAGTFQRMWGWGVLNGGAAMQTCTGVCHVGLAGSGAGQLTQAVGIGVDASGNVWVTDPALKRIQSYTASGTSLSAVGWGVLDGSLSLQVCTATCQAGVGGSGDGQFDSPAQIAGDASGNLFVTDNNPGRIEVMSSAGAFVRSWGALDSSAPVYFNAPWGVALGPGNESFVVDAGANKVDRLAYDGTALPSWGGPGAGDGQFNLPTAIARAPDGGMYVVDSGANRVERFGADGAFVTAWGGFGSGAGQFDGPLGVAVGPSGQVFVVDSSNKRVQEFGPNGAFIREWPGLFDASEGIAAGPNGVYVSDFLNGIVHQFDLQGNVIRAIGSPGTGDGQFGAPAGVAIGPDGSLWVVDFGLRRVQRFTADGVYLGKFGSQGAGDGQFVNPIGITVDCRGSVYVTDYSLPGRLQKFGDPNAEPPPCPASGGGEGGGGGSAAAAPRLSLRLAPSKFRTKARTVKRGKRKIRQKPGTKLIYELNKDASVEFTVERRFSGRVVKGRCKQPRSAKAKGRQRGRRCVAYKRVGSFAAQGREGSNRRAFSGKLNGRRLKPARYRMKAAAKDAAGLRSDPVSAAFKVIR